MHRKRCAMCQCSQCVPTRWQTGAADSVQVLLGSAALTSNGDWQQPALNLIDRRSCLSSPDWPTALSDSSPDIKGAPHACPALQCALLVSQGEGIVCPQPECMCQACRGSQPSSFCHLQCSSCCEQHHLGWWLLCSGNVVKIALPTSQGHSAWRAVLTAHRCLTMAYSTRPGLRSPQQWQKAYLQNLLVQLPLQHMLAHHS